MTAVVIRGTPYPIVLPTLEDPRLHLAATITSLQVIGQVGFGFRLSIAQILISLATCAVIEVAVAFRKQHVILWPASALLTGNGVAFILRVPGTAHGDWWSLRGWWIFMGASAVSLLSKYVIKWRGEHIFNPSNIGLVLCFLILGRGRADPLDFWWGPMSTWLVLALAVIIAGGFTILGRLKLLWIALAFWASFAVGIAVLAASHHAMTARWHLGPIAGFQFWRVLLTSPEVLVFLFFMITDPKTAPRAPRARIGYAVSLGLLGALLIAPTTTEFAAKVALLSSLAIVCVAMPLLSLVPVRIDRTRAVLVAAAAIAAYAVVVIFANASTPALAVQELPPGALPQIQILPSPGVQSQLDRRTAELIAHDLVAVEPVAASDTLRIHLEPGSDQNPPTAVTQVGARTYRLHLTAAGTWAPASAAQAPTRLEAIPTAPTPAGERLTDVAATVGLDFRQGSFRYGMSNDTKAMMGGGVCWLDYNRDGWQDLFAVNSYSSADTPQWEAHGGLPRSALFENVHGAFHDVAASAHADLQVQGDGCAAADLNGDGWTDLVVTTTSGVDLLWNHGGTFSGATLPANGWYTGVAVADVNGDGLPDIFVAGYSDLNAPVPGSVAGFPTNVGGIRDLLFLNEGHGAFREVGAQAGLEAANFRHGLGAVFTDVNGDGRPDLYVANDEDPNQLYVNVPWPGGVRADPAGLGFRFEERAAAEGVADPFAGMGVAAADGKLLVTNSRGEPSAAYRRAGAAFTNDRPNIDPALGTGFAGWGASWVDLTNSGSPDLVLTAGAIPVTSLARDAEPLRVLAPAGATRFGNANGIVGPSGLSLNGRGLAAADAGNDGRMEIAVNTIGGRLVLLRPSGPSGHWLDVSLSRFAPGTVVTAVLPDGRRISREVQAGSSYLSSEDPRVHFGLGAATRVAVLTVRTPSVATLRLTNVRGDRVLKLVPPVTLQPPAPTARVATLPGCTPVTGDRSVARIWNDAAVAVLRDGAAAEPVQARDLYELSAAVQHAYTLATPAGRDAAISYTAYRLLVWQASYNTNLARTFGLLTRRLRALCYSPDFTSLSGPGAALGNRVAATATRTGRSDGSNERLHFADPTFAAQNAPLIVSQAGSTVHDATFWQPLALSQVSPRGSGSVPAKVQSFVGSQWGGVRTFAGKVHVAGPALGDPSGKAYRQAAFAAIRATAEPLTAAKVDPTPLGWNALLDTLPSGGLATDVRLDLALNGALNDAAVSAFGAKRTYQLPRPISMIRYLAFNSGLPIVSGLTRRNGARIEVRSQGRWVDGNRWSPPVLTPASPGWPSADSAFASAADTVLSALTGRSFHARAVQAGALAASEGIELPGDANAGRKLGVAVGRLALARDR